MEKPPLTLYSDLYDLFVFDLDGTLAETRKDLMASLNHALDRLGHPRHDLVNVGRFTGKGAAVFLDRALGIASTRERVDEGVRIFLVHYEEHCLDNTRLYPGVAETVDSLGRCGKKLAVLTNKPIAMSLKILQGLGIADRFEEIHGGDSFPEKKPDPLGFREIMTGAGVSPGRAIMIGDSAVDVNTARAAGAAMAGAAWGFKPEEFRENPPDYLLQGMADLLGPVSPFR